jgi:hypothetical protein
MLTGTQAVFTPANTAALKTAVTACLGQDGGSGRSHCNPYGDISGWNTSLVEDMSYSKL